MQRVSALLPSWDRTRTTAGSSQNNNNTNFRTGRQTAPSALDRVFGWASNRNSTTAVDPASVVRETYWPSSLDKECDKAARILKSFCTDGFLAADAAESRPASPTSAAALTSFVAKKIPPRIIQNAYGLAIFSCMRSELYMSGSGGSGILIARKADGTWSPPAGILLQTADLAFVMGVDIYDCVLVINSVAILELFTRSRVTLGTDVNLSVGPLVKMIGPLDQNIRWRELESSVLTYLKARGKHQGVPLNGSLVQERGNENERFYGGPVSTLDILSGSLPKNVPETKPLFEVIKAAEGRNDFDEALMRLLSQQPAPGDAVIEVPTDYPLSPLTSPMQSTFGIPDKEDPDPFGVIALEMAGLEIREAGTRFRPTSSQFDYNPSPTSPVFSKFNRASVDTSFSRSNRGSYMSSRTQATAMTDACTQTDTATPDTTLSHANSEDGRDCISEKLPTVMEPEEIDYTKIDSSAIEHISRPESEEPPSLEETPVNKEQPQVEHKGLGTDNNADAAHTTPEPTEEQNDCDADDEDDEDEEEEPIICEVATAQPTRAAIMSSQVAQVIQAKGSLVNIPKRVPPPLPARSPARTSRASKSEFGGDVSSLRSPLRTSFQSTDLLTESGSVSPHSPLRSSFVPSDLEDAQPQDATEVSGPAEAVSPVSPLSADEAAETAEFAKRASDFARMNEKSHQRNASLSHVAVQPESRWSQDRALSAVSAISASRDPPPQSQATSSAEESEREPKTPKPEDDIHTRGVDNEKSDLSSTRDVRIQSHHEEANPIAVA